MSNYKDRYIDMVTFNPSAAKKCMSDTTVGQYLPDFYTFKIPSRLVAGFLLLFAFAASAGAAQIELVSASQSSNYRTTRGLAGDAIDGNTAGRWRDRTITHTASSTEFQPWWSVELDNVSNIDEIRLWNRTDGTLGNRLTDFYVLVSSNPFETDDLSVLLNDSSVWSGFHPGPAGEVVSIPVDVAGRYVRVQLQGQGVLSLAEVEVFGTVTESPQPPVVVNNAPVAMADTVAVQIGGSVIIPVLGNDTDSDGVLDPDSVLASDPAAGSVLLESNGTIAGTSIMYVHDGSGSAGDEVTFTYTVKDNDGEVSNAATVTVTLLSNPNVAPVAANDEPTESVAIGESLTIDVLSNDEDSDGDLDVNSVLASIASAVPQSDGTIVFTPCLLYTSPSPRDS